MPSVSKQLSSNLLSPNEHLISQMRKWVSYWRANPHRFAVEILNIPLKPFQQILLVAMMVNNFFMFVASRGLGREK